MSQAALAQRAGTSRPTLSAHERGRKSPSLDSAARIVGEAGFDLVLEPSIAFVEHAVDRGRPLLVRPRCRDCSTLQVRPREAVLFALHSLRDVELAWTLAHSLALDEPGLWEHLAKAYEKIDPIAVLPILADLVRGELQVADAQRYRSAARRLAKMRKLAYGTDKATEVDILIAELREGHRRRPRLQREFDRAGLP